MHDCRIQPPHCQPDDYTYNGILRPGDCGCIASIYPPFTLRLPYIWLHFRSDFGALIYFGLYFIISTYILLSLFVAVIVDNFAACSLNEVQTTLQLDLVIITIYGHMCYN